MLETESSTTHRWGENSEYRRFCSNMCKIWGIFITVIETQIMVAQSVQFIAVPKTKERVE